MDPNKALQEARTCAGEILSQDDDGVLDDTTQTGSLINAFNALDGWLSVGGFLPDEWKRSGMLTSMEVNVISRALEREKDFIRQQVHNKNIRPAEGAAWLMEVESAVQKILGVKREAH